MKSQQNTQNSAPPADFIPANESKLVITFFKWYTYFLCKRRFSRVWVKQDTAISQEQPVLFVVNHHSWWDGLIPLLLNEFIFHKRARAIMEDTQMRQYRFFSRIGAMSINRGNIRSALYTLQHASEWLNEVNTALFLFPEGKITNPATPIHIEGGVMRIINAAPECLLVPISIFFSHQRGNKPELFIQIGEPESDISALRISDVQTIMQTQLDALREESLATNHSFRRLI